MTTSKQSESQFDPARVARYQKKAKLNRKRLEKESLGSARMPAVDTRVLSLT